MAEVVGDVVALVVRVDVAVVVAVVEGDDVCELVGVDDSVVVCEVVAVEVAVVDKDDVAVVVPLEVADVVGVVIWHSAKVPSTYESNAALSNATLSPHDSSSFKTALMEHDTSPPPKDPMEYSSMTVFNALLVAAQSLPPSSKTLPTTPFGAEPHSTLPVPLHDSIILFSTCTCTWHRSALVSKYLSLAPAAWHENCPNNGVVVCDDVPVDVCEVVAVVDVVSVVVPVDVPVLVADVVTDVVVVCVDVTVLVAEVVVVGVEDCELVGVVVVSVVVNEVEAEVVTDDVPVLVTVLVAVDVSDVVAEVHSHPSNEPAS